MYKNKPSLFVLLLLILTLSVNGQDTYNFRQFTDETVEFVKQPINWQPTDLLRLGAILGSTYGLMYLDEQIREYMLRDTTWRGSIPLEFGRYWGEPPISLLLGSGLLIIGANHENKSAQKLGFEILQSFAYSVSVNGALKILFGRARPSTGLNAFTFKPLTSFKNDYWSLPSGHTTVAFSLSTVLAENTDSPGLKVLAYIPAIITAYSRVDYNRHWLSDVFLGGLSGYFIAKYVTELHKQDNNNSIIYRNDTSLISFSVNF